MIDNPYESEDEKKAPINVVAKVKNFFRLNEINSGIGVDSKIREKNSMSQSNAEYDDYYA